MAFTPAAEPDLTRLYASLAGRLERIVRLDVRAPDAVIEDACQSAWTSLVVHCTRVRREAALAWLTRAAVREAVRLVERESRELSLDLAGVDADSARSAEPYELLEVRERLALMRGLPQRQQRLLWLHAVGLSYTEMAAHESCTRRTVERQLLRAKQSIRETASE